jgi:hypothetical protein
MKNIETHIDQDKKELSDPQLSPQRRRHLEDELEQLEVYQQNHPEDHYDPTPLELYCELNPNAPECKIYED